MDTFMFRLFLGFIAAAVLLYGGLRFMSSNGPGPTPTAVSTPATIRTVSNDIQRIQAQNRGALDRNVKSSER
jgi:hypothetical protein